MLTTSIKATVRRNARNARKATTSAPKCSGLKLLTPGNPKTMKGEKLGYVTFILHLAPADLSGHEVCPKRSKGCTKACLNTAGRGGTAKGKGKLTFAEIQSGARSNAIQAARIRRTKLYFEQRAQFMALLVADIAKASKWARARGFVPVFRLNGTSDIRFELGKVTYNGREFRNVFEAFSDLQFYDYTKIENRRNIPANYDLTFSLSEDNDSAAAKALANGMRVAAVFRNRGLVETYMAFGLTLAGSQFNVIDGDDSDLRFLEPAGCIVALYAKGNGVNDDSGFVRD